MKTIQLILIIPFVIFFVSCEDSAPGDYEENYIVEALLLVDKPIKGISIIKTQPIFDVYVHDSAMVRNANVIIEGDGRSFNLQFKNREDGEVGYFYDDTSYLIKENTQYKIKITLPNGKLISGETTTPGKTEWVKRAKDFLQFPLDTLKLPSTDTVIWKKVPMIDFYLIGVTSLDTLEYGSYLNPSTEEMNRRIERPWRQDRFFREISSISPIANTQSTIVWNTFRWFGKHEVVVYAPDWNFLRWYIQSQARQELDPLLSSITGAYGFVGSASIISDTSFVLKNQP